MADDIVTRLQQRVDLTALFARAALGDATVCEEAAAEIERLRRWKAEAIEVLNRWDAVAVMVPSRLGERKSETAVAEIERLRAAGDALAKGIRNGQWDDALDAWEEARRG